MPKKNTTAAHWSAESEERLVELWPNYPATYDVNSAEYHDRNKKAKSWQELADILGKSVSEVLTKISSLRTQFGKARKPKPSGSSAEKDLTPRNKWILKNLDFLSPFVMHKPTKTTLTVDDMQSSDTSPVLPSDHLSSDEEQEMVDSSDTSIISEICTPRPDPPVSSSKKSSKSAKQQSEDSIEREKVAILKSLSQVVAGSRNDVDECFGRQVVSEMKEIKDEGTKKRLRRNIINMIYDAAENASRPAPYPTHTDFQTPWQGHPPFFQNPRNTGFMGVLQDTQGASWQGNLGPGGRPGQGGTLATELRWEEGRLGGASWEGAPGPAGRLGQGAITATVVQGEGASHQEFTQL